MKSYTSLLSAVCAAALLIGSSQIAPAYGDDEAEDLLGANENPPVVSAGDGEFEFDIDDDVIEFELEYDVASDGSDVQQAHIHIANPGNNGGIAIFLCTNLGNNPGSPSCPPSPGEVADEIVADDVRRVTFTDSQGRVTVILEAGDLDGLQRLMEDGATYVNVHTDDHPPGEIRGQLNARER